MNKKMQWVGFALLAVSALGYLVVIVDESIDEGGVALLVLAALGGFVLLLGQALKDRLSNSEDDYYSKNVEK